MLGDCNTARIFLSIFKNTSSQLKRIMTREHVPLPGTLSVPSETRFSCASSATPPSRIPSTYNLSVSFFHRALLFTLILVACSVVEFKRGPKSVPVAWARRVSTNPGVYPSRTTRLHRQHRVQTVWLVFICSSSVSSCFTREQCLWKTSGNS